MRIRQIKPEFFSDAGMAELSIRARLTYVGLWCIADDAGWLPIIDAAEIGHLLYGYESGKTRERWIVEDVSALQEACHLDVLPCGHAIIPSLPRHQRMKTETRTVFMHRNSHERMCCSAAVPQSIPGIPRNSPEFPVGTERNGKERNGTVVARERASGGLKDRLGDLEDIVR